MPFVAAGASSMPIILGHLTQQVPANQVGALQGSCETVRTIASALGSPLFAGVFALCLRESEYPVGSALMLCGACSGLGCVLFTVLR